MFKNILVLIAISFLFNACVVSKKKYDSLLSDKNKLSRELTEERKENDNLQSNLEQAIKDFEKMKGDFGSSNALRSDEIADLILKVTQLEDKSAELQSKLDETQSKFKATEKSGYMTEEELRNATEMLTALKRDTANLHYSINMAKQRSEYLQEELVETKSELSNSNTKYYEANKALEAQTAEVKAMEQKLVKSQQTLDDISKTFIELRKQLLTAKSSNTPIDPNNNSNINKIAKSLGHY